MQDVRAADLDGERGLGQDRVQAQRLRLAIEYRLAGQPGLDPLLDRFRLGLPTHTVDLPGVRLGLEQTRDQGGLEVSQLDRLGLVGDERSVAAGERVESLPPAGFAQIAGEGQQRPAHLAIQRDVVGDQQFHDVARSCLDVSGLDAADPRR